MTEPLDAKGLGLVVVELKKQVCADYLWTSLHERKMNFHFVLTFFFFVYAAELDSNWYTASTEEYQWRVKSVSGKKASAVTGGEDGESPLASSPPTGDAPFTRGPRLATRPSMSI